MLVERLVAEFERPSGADRLYAESLLQAVCALVIRTCGSPGRETAAVRDGGLPPRRLAEVLDFIHANVASRVALEDLAAVAGFSASHFTRRSASRPGSRRTAL
ncbi:hypothetical protein N4P33_23925 [Streptomyces sp. 15-116A]|uniref:helix-turn-helix transcriptional regulator n=1 Tax=Streptomyces sp. 15-116A TaxID=2259035 RepID=UPI0021B3672A|nr:hypothetical protein [Streptomyces sp. 15-116A]MCT7355178.1 hypothetical protein [Streptomyces sp. 15-116A]